MISQLKIKPDRIYGKEVLDPSCRLPARCQFIARKGERSNAPGKQERSN